MRTYKSNHKPSMSLENILAKLHATCNGDTVISVRFESVGFTQNYPEAVSTLAKFKGDINRLLVMAENVMHGKRVNTVIWHGKKYS